MICGLLSDRIKPILDLASPGGDGVSTLETAIANSTAMPAAARDCLVRLNNLRIQAKLCVEEWRKAFRSYEVVPDESGKQHSAYIYGERLTRASACLPWCFPESPQVQPVDEQLAAALLRLVRRPPRGGV